ncbi:unnamed protein product (macronuclear) [Paramecium tetraurelia]|uniref:Ubiquitin fusion degradation protein n=1 Tax=Paramecium tetraurelia TaxID=5888 RepID=A0CHG3_PARTE|nr:uncharacterized protein GSPATT00038332001 [Paramecium tetraurelia]CAK70230.1 unnamed protein product [Paramecium tetraurelia]|eukprot:XP_001437627.1 hypothetical protein (macronuclear) [Paramecium tetraurelia strain d4-2]
MLYQKSTQRHTYVEHLTVHSASSYGRPQINNGNKILLPASALQQLIFIKQNGPMIFKIQSTQSQKFTYVGVLEFVAEEGSCIIPDWLFENMNFFNRCWVIVSLEQSLPLGKLIKIQPHETAFIDLPDPRAILENQLRNYICLTQGETITITFNKIKYMIDIVSVTPKTDKLAVCINEADVEIDFLQPLDYTEAPPQKLVKNNSTLGMEQDQQQQQSAVFTGKGVRLDGKTGVAQPRKQSEDVKIVAEPYNPRKNKLVNGIRQAEDVQLFTGTCTKVGAQKKQL